MFLLSTYTSCAKEQEKQRAAQLTAGEAVDETPIDPKHNSMIMMRILGPVITFVDKPWKVREF
jgi:high-affinity nickel-transport protein